MPCIASFVILKSQENNYLKMDHIGGEIKKNERNILLGLSLLKVYLSLLDNINIVNCLAPLGLKSAVLVDLMLKLAGVWHLNLQTFKLTINEPLYPLWKNSQYQSVYLELCFCIKPKAYVTALNWPALEMFLDVWYHYTTWKSTHLPTTLLYTEMKKSPKR